jgi:hypothetical protein
VSRFVHFVKYNFIYFYALNFIYSKRQK